MPDLANGDRWFDFEGARVYFRRHGAGEAIVFLPNATLTGRLWDHQLHYFAATHDVIAVDLPGFGRSDRLPQGPSLSLYVRWLERFVDELDIAPAVLVGNCIGSLMALHYAAEHPRSVAALVLMNTLDASVAAAGPMGRGAGLLKLGPLRPLLEWAVAHTPASLALRHPYPHSQFGDLPQPHASAYHEHAIGCFAEPQTRLALVRLGYDSGNHVLPQWQRLAVRPPMCWIWGEANRLLPLEAGKRQIALLEPEEVHILKRRGYAAAWEAPGEVNTIIERFLRRYRPVTMPGGRRAARIAAPQSAG